MKPKGSLPHPQQPATRPYPEPDRSTPCSNRASRTSILILPSHLRLGRSSGLLLSGFLTKTLHAPLLFPIRATCPAHLQSSWFDRPNVISLKIFENGVFHSDEWQNGGKKNLITPCFLEMRYLGEVGDENDGITRHSKDHVISGFCVVQLKPAAGDWGWSPPWSAEFNL